METLELNKNYSFTSHSGKKCIGKFIGLDKQHNIIFNITESHPFNIDENGNCIFYLSTYYFFKYFKPTLID
jgi:hypothetical protein